MTALEFDHPLNRRLTRILKRATGRQAAINSHGSPFVPTGATNAVGANAYLRVMSDRPEGELAVYPADTLTQAQAFYGQHNAVAGVRRLRARSDWHARPNFHFGSFQRGYCWTCNQRELDEYVELWVRRIAREHALRRQDWDRYWSWLETERIACPADRPEFDRHFVKSKRQVAVPRPGLLLSCRWPLEQAQALGSDDDLQQRVRQSLNDAIDSFGASPRMSP